MGTPVSGLLWRVSTRWRAAIDRAVTPHGLTHAQYAVLAPLLTLHRSGTRPSQRRLADFTGLEPLYVSKLARSLEQAGLLTRTPDPDDSRAMLLSPTDHGRECAERAIAAVRALQDDLTAPLGGLDSPRTRALVDALHTLLDDRDPADHMPDSPTLEET
ncbi:MarR family winged helix-turn-helix transcriptional regulator [Actinokineospora globicatena]|uniref:MarR family transcriptional regulator n=1 Tax=Actinokineospora globicatena TaxID=103729 RepID=A0A9W6V8R5_9PSEU|nr:MarR family transcriptional regulator [Actinokineospora globicatena]GLW90246.1 MarR family transcriptional regulator [Actinokineospora globicatena]